MKVNITKTNFTSGELSPRLLGRKDYDKYSNGVKSSENVIIHPHGGAARRPGTQFIEPTKGGGVVRLVRFSFSVTQNYVLEFGHNYIRFFKDHQLIKDVGVPVELVTAYTVDEVFDLKFVQDADKLYIVHGNHHPAELTRTSHIAWTLVNMPFITPPADWVAGNYPSAIGLFQQRIIFAATPGQPQVIWGSKVGDIYDFTVPTTLDNSEPFIYGIASDQVNAINWMSTGETIMVGTVGAEYSLSSSREGEPISSTNVRVVRETNYGSARNVVPVRIDNSVLYVQYGGRKVREHLYDVYSDGSTGNDATILSEHITKSGIKQTTYQNEPDSIFWALRNDGKIIGMTYEKGQKVIAWHRHEIGGTDVVVVAILALNSTIDPASADFTPSADELWMVVERTIGGVTKRYIEVAVVQDPIEVAQSDLYYMDGGLTGDFPGGTATVSGLDHLEGETVEVVVDGATHPDRTVVSGAITLDSPAEKVHVGYHAPVELVTMPLTEGGNQGDAFLQTKRISRVLLLMYKSLGLQIGPEDGELDTVSMGPGLMGNAPELVSGVVEVDFPGDYEDAGTVVLRQDSSLPFNILAMVAEYRTK